MAIFLSRIKRALNVGSKSITNNGTYYASADGYDGYDEVTVNVSGGSATPITPSNANPVALSSGVAVEPTANGYAIESYSEVTPQEGIANQLVSGSFVKMNGSGYGIKDFTQITPSNAVPVSLSSNKFYKTGAGASGYAISSYSSKTPSDSSPASVSSGAIIKASASGYLYATQQPKVKVGTFTGNTSTTTKVTLGFKPKYICYAYDGSTNVKDMIIYNEDMSTTKSIGAYKSSSSSQSVGEYSIGASNNNTIYSIDSDGFTVQKMSSTFGGQTFHYFAIG